MSGPIVRKYGFPNFDKIFGERPIEHGVEEPGPQADEASTKKTKPEPSAQVKASKTKKPKKS